MTDGVYPARPDRNIEDQLIPELLEYLFRVLERPLRRGNPGAIRDVLAVARRQAKLHQLAGSRVAAPITKERGFPITIFSEAIKAMEKKRNENKSS